MKASRLGPGESLDTLLKVSGRVYAITLDNLHVTLSFTAPLPPQSPCCVRRKLAPTRIFSFTAPLPPQSPCCVRRKLAPTRIFSGGRDQMKASFRAHLFECYITTWPVAALIRGEHSLSRHTMVLSDSTTSSAAPIRTKSEAGAR